MGGCVCSPRCIVRRYWQDDERIALDGKVTADSPLVTGEERVQTNGSSRHARLQGDLEDVGCLASGLLSGRYRMETHSMLLPREGS